MSNKLQTPKSAQQTLEELCALDTLEYTHIQNAIQAMSEKQRWRLWILTQEKSAELFYQIPCIAFRQHGISAAILVTLSSLGIQNESIPKPIQDLIAKRRKILSIEQCIARCLGHKLSDEVHALGSRYRIR